MSDIKDAREVAKDRLYFKILLIVFLLAFIASVLILYAYDVRPYIYYVVITVVATIILLEIMLLDTAGKKRFIILTQIMAMSLNIIWGGSLKYYYFVGQTDLISHAWWAYNIMITGTIPSMMTTYTAFPLWHILAAFTSEVTGLGISMDKIMIVNSGLIMSIVGVLAIYAITKKLTGNYQLSLLSSLFLSVFPTFIFYGMYSIPRSIVPIFMMLVVLLLIDRGKKVNYYLALALMPVITIYHTVSIIFVTIIFFGIYMFQKFIHIEKKDTLINLAFIITSVVLTMIYWIANGNQLIYQLYANIVTAAPSDTLPASVIYTPLNELANYVQYSFFILFILLGFFIIMRGKFNSMLKVMSIMALVLIPFSFPGPLLLISKLAANFDISRFDEYSFLFMSIVSAVGFGLMYVKSNRYFRVALILLFAVLVVLAISNDFVASDNPLIKRAFYTDYLTQGEITGASTMMNITMPNGYIMTDYILARYIANTPDTNASQVVEIDINNSTLLKSSPADVIVIRTGELEKRDLELNIVPTGVYDSEAFTDYDYVNKTTIFANISIFNKIYDSNDIEAYN
jgi:hypothetical protein